MCLTWNVNQQRPDANSRVFHTVADAGASASIVVVALQEIEMGSSSVAIAAAKDALRKSAQVSLPLTNMMHQSAPGRLRSRHSPAVHLHEKRHSATFVHERSHYCRECLGLPGCRGVCFPEACLPLGCSWCRPSKARAPQQLKTLPAKLRSPQQLQICLPG